MDAWHRVRQFYHALAAPLIQMDLSPVRHILGVQLFRLFEQLPPVERSHSLRVLGMLQQEGYSDPDLLQAALLHDVGKSSIRLRLHERVLIVLLSPVMRKLTAGTDAGRKSRWQNMLRIARQHPRWGAEMVLQAGGSETLVWLIRNHQHQLTHSPRNRKEEMLLALQAADRKN